jgi:shikimate dehydrogenase
MTDRYAVIGNPIGHSKSPLIHGMFAEATGQDLVYAAIEGPLGGFAGAVDVFRAQGGRGLNVTVPFKLDAAAYATDLSPRARLAGAVNALKFDGGRVLAENFDGVGLINDIERNLGHAVAGQRVLMLGAGGAARGAIPPFLERKAASVTIANRTLERAEALARQFGGEGDVHAFAYDQLGALPPFDIVVNATSASLRGELPPAPASSFAEGCLAYEMAYGKGLTPFLQLARSRRAGRVADGVGMLVEQAAEAFAWWRGVRPDTARVIATLTIPLI